MKALKLFISICIVLLRPVAFAENNFHDSDLGCKGYTSDLYNNFDPYEAVAFSIKTFVPYSCGDAMKVRNWLSLGEPSGGKSLITEGSIKLRKAHSEEASESSYSIEPAVGGRIVLCNSKISVGQIDHLPSKGKCWSEKVLSEGFRSGKNRIECEIKWKKSKLKILIKKGYEGSDSYSSISIFRNGSKKIYNLADSIEFYDFDSDDEIDALIGKSEGFEFNLSSGVGRCLPKKAKKESEVKGAKESKKSYEGKLSSSESHDRR